MKVKKKSQIQERKIAKDINGNVVVASGSLWGSKGDVRNETYLVEAKYTGTTGYTLSYTTWDKIRKEAINDGLRIPIMQITVQGNHYALLQLDDLKAMAEDKNCVLELSHTLPVKKSVKIPNDYMLQMANNPKGIPYVKYEIADKKPLALIWWENFKFIM